MAARGTVGEMERELVRRAQRGQREAFAEIYRRFLPRLVRYCGRLREGEGQEIAQESMTRALAGLAAFDPHRSLWPWLKTIAINLAIDQVRRSGREVPVAEPAPRALPNDDLHGVEERVLLRTALSRLNGRQRQAVGLRYVADWEPARIAAHLNLSETAFKQMLFRARRRLALEYRRAADSPFGLVLAPGVALRRFLIWARLRATDASLGARQAGAQAVYPVLAGVLGITLLLGGAAPRGVDRAEASTPGRHVELGDPLDDRARGVQTRPSTDPSAPPSAGAAPAPTVAAQPPPKADPTPASHAGGAPADDPAAPPASTIPDAPLVPPLEPVPEEPPDGPQHQMRPLPEPLNEPEELIPVELPPLLLRPREEPNTPE